MTNRATTATPEAIALIRQPATQATHAQLDQAAKRLAEGLTDSFAAIIGKTLRLSYAGRQRQSFAAWQKMTTLPVLGARYRGGDTKLDLTVLFPLPLLAWLVDIFYGGDGAAIAPREHMTVAERRMGQRLAAEVPRIMTAAWANIADIAPILHAVDLSLAHGPFVNPDEELLILHFDLACDNAGVHRIEMACAPALWCNESSTANISLSPVIEPAWQARLKTRAMQIRLPVRAILVQQDMPISRLLRLQAGDIIPICLPREIPVMVAGRHFASGTLGESDGRAALCITQCEKG